ncbi:hypothetical protein PG990_013863 [Apiospora arundinis]
MEEVEIQEDSKSSSGDGMDEGMDNIRDDDQSNSDSNEPSIHEGASSSNLRRLGSVRGTGRHSPPIRRSQCIATRYRGSPPGDCYALYMN